VGPFGAYGHNDGADDDNLVSVTWSITRYGWHQTAPAKPRSGAPGL